MLEIELDVVKGIIFLRLNGQLNDINFNLLSNRINELLYQQGIHYYVLDFQDTEIIEKTILSKIQNKLIEIFLSCGKVVLCGIDDINQKQIGYTKDKLFYVQTEREAFEYLWM